VAIETSAINKPRINMALKEGCTHIQRHSELVTPTTKHLIPSHYIVTVSSSAPGNSTFTVNKFCFFIVLVSCGGVTLSPFGIHMSATNWPIVSAPDDREVWRIWCKQNWQEEPKYWDNIHPIVTYCFSNSIWLDLRSKWGSGRLNFTINCLVMISL
jgi:hypothetical protein